QLPKPGHGTVEMAYGQLREEGLLNVAQGKGTWVAGPAEDPPPELPADWPAELRRAVKEHPLLEQTLREYILDLPPGTHLPPHEQMAQLLKLPEIPEIPEIPGIPPLAVREAY